MGAAVEDAGRLTDKPSMPPSIAVMVERSNSNKVSLHLFASTDRSVSKDSWDHPTIATSTTSRMGVMEDVSNITVREDRCASGALVVAKRI